MDTTRPTKSVKIDKDLHERLKKKALSSGMKLGAMIDRMLEKGLKEAKEKQS